MDIDIDVPTNFNRAIFPWAKATVIRENKITPHPAGMYPQNMPIDPISGLAAIPYDVAEELGYFKLDFLHLNVYSLFNSRSEIEALCNVEPDWTLLQVPSNHEKIFQLSKHGDLLLKIKPKSTEELADVLALIRPGKKQLLGLYSKDKEMCRRALWARDENGYSFKKSHALGYAYVIQLQLHLISQGRL